MLYHLDRFFRRVAGHVFVPVAYATMPIKRVAWRSDLRLVRGLALELTSLVDWLMVVACVQNQAMAIQHRVWNGNFIFGKAIFVVDHAQATREIPEPTLRGNHFVGVHLVTNEAGVFLTNAGPITTAPPVRTATRAHIQEHVMTAAVRRYERGGIEDACAEILDQWRAMPDMASATAIRTVCTRIYLKLLAGVEPSYEVAAQLTGVYIQRFGEMSLLGRYFPSLLGALGTLEALREDVFIPMRKMGIDPVAIDMTLFAAMFSNGTWALHAVRLAREEDIDYCALDEAGRIRFLMETQRVYPTVTSVHRIAESAEEIEVSGERLPVRPGQEICYPFVAINRDPAAFDQPDRFSTDRPPEELARILSWSIGPHVCPAKDLSIRVALTMVDTLASVHDLRELRIFSLEF